MASGEAKGLKQVLNKCRFSTAKLCTKCEPIYLFESQNCCLAQLLSQQGDFTNQLSMLKALIKGAGHKRIFLPKFHCELNPIETVHKFDLDGT
jgi:hypothetical protein